MLRTYQRQALATGRLMFYPCINHGPMSHRDNGPEKRTPAPCGTTAEADTANSEHNSREMEWFLAQLFTFLAFALDMAMFITTPIYILVLITLWKNRNEETLKHAFFKLMISVGIADVGTILNIFFTIRLAEWGWAPQIFIWLGGMSSRIANTCKSFFGTSQSLGVLVVALNRYTAFMIPLRHQK
uniref:G-protein coupled receptors family 1 profile domain-containing protein n=1 Tax=Plectus sambesii TaxID=2011161 RepID=A0A914WXN2_9BILA